MRIDVYHASKYGNGAKVAGELKHILESRGHQVNVHHIDDANPKELPPADRYVFGAPTRMNKPLGSMKRFLKKAALAPGTRYAVFATHTDAVPDKKTGRMPTPEELKARRMNVPTLMAILQDKGLVKVADTVFDVDVEEKKGSFKETMAGRLREGWQERAEEFANAILGAA